MSEVKSATPVNPKRLQTEAADEVAADLEADVYLYAGSVYPPSDRALSLSVRKNRSRKNALLYIATFGGSADTAYRVARSLQAGYSDGVVTLFVAEFCKSAGTLLAIGANELVMPDGSELGPLDVQIAQHDSLAGRVSGLTPVQALSTLREEAFKSFEKFFLDVVHSSGGRITTPTASKIAVQLTTGLFRPVYAQIEPMRLGEYGRSLLVADDYGMRLDDRFKNLKPGALAQLVAGYPSHEFVIDRAEAMKLFSRVRLPTAKEATLGGLLEDEVWKSLDGQVARVKCLSTKAAAAPDEESTDGKSRIPNRAAPPTPRGTVRRTPAAGKPNGKPTGKPTGKGTGRSRPAHSTGENGVPIGDGLPPVR